MEAEESNHKLSQSRRQLLRELANTLRFLALFLVTVLVVFAFAYNLAEEYSLLESFHWAMQTMSTTGYGDKPPQTSAGMLLAIVLQPTSVITTVLATAHVVKNAIKDPNEWTHEEQVQLRADLHEVKTLLKHIASRENA